VFGDVEGPRIQLQIRRPKRRPGCCGSALTGADNDRAYALLESDLVIQRLRCM
jgi:hypothetical protein